MKTLMTNLETLGFTKETGLNGLSLNNIAVSLHWSFLNGVCRHELREIEDFCEEGFLNGVCRHERYNKAKI